MRGTASRAGRRPKAPVHKTRGSRRSGRLGEPAVAPGAVAAFDRALAALLAAEFPGAPLQVPHRCFAVIAKAPP